MNTISVVQGEQKWLRFRVLDKNKQLLPLEDKELLLELKTSSKTISKETISFDLTEGTGIAKVLMTSSDLNTPGTFTGRLKVTFPAETGTEQEIHKSPLFTLIIQKENI